MVATYIDEKGFIRFAQVGGLFKGDLINIQVRFAGGTRGVISYEEKTPFKDITLDNLFIDIGAADRADAERQVQIGIDGQKKRVCGNPKHNRKEHIRKSWDKTIPPPEYFRELERVSKAQVIWGGNYFVPYLEQGHKGWLVWDKGQHGLTMSDCELAYTSFDTPTRVFVCNRVELLNDGTIHPTQKPVKLYSWVLSLFARKGMKILDTHAGSGSSLIACYRQGGLDFVGFEIDEDYCRAANERLEQEQAQIRLFDLLEQEERKAQATLFTK